MNTQNDNHAPVSADELNDRLMDIALAERVGGAAPPDLSVRILAAHSDTQVVRSETKQLRDQAHPLRWFVAAIAATLLAGATTLLYVESKLDSRGSSVARTGGFRTTAKVDSAIVLSAPASQENSAQQPPATETDGWHQLSASEVEDRIGRAAAPIESKYVELYGLPASESGVTKTKAEIRPVPAQVAASSAPTPPAEAPLEVPGFANAQGKEPVVVAQRPTWGMPPAPGKPSGPGMLAAAPGRPETFYTTPQGDNRVFPTQSYEQSDYQNMFLYRGAGQANQQQSSDGLTPQLAAAPRQQLSSANDGTLDLYSHSEQPADAAKQWAPLYAFTDPRLHKAGQSGEIALRPELPGPPPIEQLTERLNERVHLRSDESGDRYTPIVENPFIKAEGGDAVSTFGIDVDTASYSNVRQFLLEMHQLPPANAVRIEELVNYFHYDYAGPVTDVADPRVIEAQLDDVVDKDPQVLLMKEKLGETQMAHAASSGTNAKSDLATQSRRQLDSLSRQIDEYRAQLKAKMIHDAAVKPNASLEQLMKRYPALFAPFAAHVEVGGCPWNAEHRLARIAVKGREMERDKRPQSNLVFLVDVSGSMNEPAKLPLVKYGLEQLTKELGENDHIAIVVYAGTEGLVLPSTSGAKQDVILAALQKLEAGGSTAGGAGLQLAYQIAEDNFIKGGTNRVILCTDGDFNVGTTNTDELQKLVATKAKETGVFISTLGYGRGNLNDAMMVAISDHGNGNYHYIDNRTEARRVLVEEMTGTLVTIAKDVKIQVEFNPAKVAAYRLIGYEKRMLQTQDFNDDKKDAGEIGAGHTVTALYEIVPAGKKIEPSPAVDDLKYQKAVEDAAAEQRKLLDAVDRIHRTLSADATSEMLTLKMRYKAPDGDTSQKLEWPVTDGGNSFGNSTEDFRFAAAVAGFGMLLRDSQYIGDLTFKDVLAVAENALGHDEHGYRSEFSEMVREAQKLKGE